MGHLLRGLYGHQLAPPMSRPASGRSRRPAAPDGPAPAPPSRGAGPPRARAVKSRKRLCANDLVCVGCACARCASGVRARCARTVCARAGRACARRRGRNPLGGVHVAGLGSRRPLDGCTCARTDNPGERHVRGRGRVRGRAHTRPPPPAGSIARESPPRSYRGYAGEVPAGSWLRPARGPSVSPESARWPAGLPAA